MPAFEGRGSAIGLGEESTYGTAVSRTHWIRLATLPRAGQNKNFVDNPVLGDQPTLQQPVNVRTRFDAQARIVASYTGQGLIWKHALGKTPVTTGSGPYTHVFEPDNTLPTGLTCEFKRGTATNAETGEGCKIGRLRFSAAVDQYAQIELDFIGETSNSAAVGTPAYATSRVYVGAWQSGDLTHDGNTYCLNALEFTVDNSLSEPTMMGCAREPTRDYARISGRFTVEYDADTLYTAFTAETVADGHVTFTGSGNNTMRFDFQNMVITKVSRPVNDGGRILQTIEFSCYSDEASGGTDSGLKVTITNDQTTAIAN